MKTAQELVDKDIIRIDPDEFKREELTLGDFLNRFEETPSIGYNAFQRLYAALTMFGSEKPNKSWKPDRWKFLDDRVESPWKRNGATSAFEIYLYGVEEPTHTIMKHLEDACIRRDSQSRAILLIGPPSSGKTDLINDMSYALDAYTTKPEGQVYTVKFDLKNYAKFFGGLESITCPTHESPLNFLAKEDLYGALKNVNDKVSDEERWKEIELNHTRCPACSYVINTLQDEAHVENWRDLVKVVNLRPGKDIAAAEFRPTDEKAYDSKRIFGGDINLERLNLFLDKNHPLAINYGIAGKINGPSPQGHIVHFSELLKAKDLGLLDQLLDLITSRELKVNESYGVRINSVLIASTNLQEYEKSVKDPRLAEYLTSRLKRVEMGYLTVIDDLTQALEKRIFNSLQKKSRIHVPPHYVKFLASMAVMSTLDDSMSDLKITILQKALIYNGEEPQGINKKAHELFKELRTIAKNHPMHELTEGIKNGIPFRFFQDLPSKYIENLGRISDDKKKDRMDSSYKGCLSIVEFGNLLEFFENQIRSYDGITSDTRRRLVDMRANTEKKESGSLALYDAHGLYKEHIIKDVNKALLGEVALLNLGTRYLAQACAFKNQNSTYIDPVTSKKGPVDKDFLESIEKASGGISGTDFREKMASYVNFKLEYKPGETSKDSMETLTKQLMEQNKSFSTAIERYALENILPNLSKTADVSLYSPANDGMMKELNKMGYCKSCGAHALTIAGELREKIKK